MPRKGMFQMLGERVMYGPSGRPGTVIQNSGYQYTPVHYPQPPTYSPPAQPIQETDPNMAAGIMIGRREPNNFNLWDPNLVMHPDHRFTREGVPYRQHLAQQASQATPPPVNPALRAAEVKDGKEHQEAAENNNRHRWHGSRKSYIPSIGKWLTKPELIDYVNSDERDWRRILRDYSPEDFQKRMKVQNFGLMKQYKLSKHEPTGSPTHPFGEMNGAASGFYNGSSADNYKGWRYMTAAEKDEMMAKESSEANMSRMSEQQAARRQATQEAQRAQQSREQEARYAQQARESAERWANMSPAEQEQIIYNRQLAEYNEAVERNQNLDILHQQQQSQPMNGGQNMGMPMLSPVMLDSMVSAAQNENTRYVPVRPRRSINDRIMSSFNPNMFSPEFIPEEENGY